MQFTATRTLQGFGRDVEKAFQDGEISANVAANLIRQKQAEAVAIMDQDLQLTPGEESLDKAFADDLIDFKQADVEKGLAQLGDAVKLLSKSDNITGPFVSLLLSFPKQNKSTGNRSKRSC